MFTNEVSKFKQSNKLFQEWWKAHGLTNDTKLTLQQFYFLYFPLQIGIWLKFLNDNNLTVEAGLYGYYVIVNDFEKSGLPDFMIEGIRDGNYCIKIQVDTEKEPSIGFAYEEGIIAALRFLNQQIQK
jgi:hypothetical protein